MISLLISHKGGGTDTNWSQNSVVSCQEQTNERGIVLRQFVTYCVIIGNRPSSFAMIGLP